MQTVFEAAGGNDGLRDLAGAWHRRVMADGVVAQNKPAALCSPPDPGVLRLASLRDLNKLAL
jgi:hypothetical protein